MWTYTEAETFARIFCVSSGPLSHSSLEAIQNILDDHYMAHSSAPTLPCEAPEMSDDPDAWWEDEASRGEL